MRRILLAISLLAMAAKDKWKPEKIHYNRY